MQKILNKIAKVLDELVTSDYESNKKREKEPKAKTRKQTTKKFSRNKWGFPRFK